MVTTANDTLNEAYELIEANRIDEARRLLEPMLDDDSDNPDLWWVYAHAVDNPADARRALKRVQEIDPAYPQVNELLGEIDELQPAAPLPAGGSGIKRIRPLATGAPKPKPLAQPDSEFDDFDDLDSDFDDFDDEDDVEQRGSRSLVLPLAIATVFGIALILGVLWLAFGGAGSTVATATPVNVTTANSATETPVALGVPPTNITAEAQSAQVSTATDDSAGGVLVATDEVTEDTSALATEAVEETDEPPDEADVTDEPTDEANVIDEADATDESALGTIDATPDTSALATDAVEETDEPTDEVDVTDEPTAETDATDESVLGTIDATPTQELLSGATDAVEELETEEDATQEAEATAELTEEPSDDMEATEEPSATAEPTNTNSPTPDADADLEAVFSEFRLNEDEPTSLLETANGDAFLVNICTEPITDRAEALNDAMTTLAQSEIEPPEDASLVGITLYMCEEDMIFRSIVTPIDTFFAYRDGGLNDRRFQLSWQVIQ